MEEHRGQTKEGLNNVPIQARESTPIRTIVLPRPDAHIAVSVYAYVFPYELLLPGPIPNNYTVPEARSRAALVCHRRRVPANPQKPYPEAPKKPDSGPEPEQIYAYKAPSRPRTPPPPPARGVWYYFTVSCLS